MRQFTSTLPETKSFYEGELKNYKTASSRKAFLTRNRKQVEEYHDDLVQAYKTNDRMLFGELVNKIDITMVVAELNIINNLYNLQ